MRSAVLKRCLVGMLLFSSIVMQAAEQPVTVPAPTTAPAPGASDAATPSPPDELTHPIPIEGVERYVSDRIKTLADHLERGPLKQTLLGIAGWRYLLFLMMVILTFVLGALWGWFLQTYAARLARKTKWTFDDILFSSATEPGKLLIHALGLLVAVLVLVLGKAPPFISMWCTRLAFAVAGGAVLWYLYRIVDVVDHYLHSLAQRTDNNMDDSIADIVRKSLRVCLLIIGIITIGNNVLDWDVTAILASAGVLGLAIAFAAQDTIANFFGTIMLLVDRPFKVGERVQMEGTDGPVESIGFRSTRIRTLDGHLVSIPNKTVANTTIENIGRRPHIKRVTTIGVTYDTPHVKLRRGVDIIKSILANHPGMDKELPPRVYFSEFGDCSLNIVFYCWYHPGEWWDYLAWCEAVNFQIMEQFEAAGLEFAFPTSTNYLVGDPNRPLVVTTQKGGKRQGSDT